MAYFDWNATTPLHPAARQAWLDAVDSGWGNPSAIYRKGANARLVLDKARDSMAELLAVRPDQIVFTSGATESNNAFIRIARTRCSGDRKIWVSAIEHPSVLEAALQWWGEGGVTRIPVGPSGMVDPEWIRERIPQEKPALICVMAVNNETGVIQPVHELGALCSQHGIPFFSDAVQWFGKVDQSIELGASMAGYSMSAHKFGGPKGTGCLVLGNDWMGSRLQVGGAQEYGSRAGTEDVAGISAMAAALGQRMQPVAGEITMARCRFEEQLQEIWPDVVIHGRNSPRVWNTCSVSLPQFRSGRWIARLDRKGFEVSTGAACSAGKKGPSRVLREMGVADESALNTLRISGGWETRPDDWNDLLNALVQVRQELNSEPEENGPGRVIEI